jgi:hypothetical protein
MDSKYQKAVTAQGAYAVKLAQNIEQNRTQIIAVLRRFNGITNANVVDTAKIGTLISNFDATSFASALSAFTNTTVAANEVDGSMTIAQVLNLVGRKEIAADMAAEQPEEPEEPSDEITGTDVMEAMCAFSGATTGPTTGTIDAYRGTKTLTEVINALNAVFEVTLNATTDNITLNTNMDQLAVLINDKLAA